MTEKTNAELYGAAKVNAVKTHCPAGHLYAGKNLYIRPNGSRVCLACAGDRRKFGWHNYHARKSWQSMLLRCHNEDDVHYPQYGARGITVCQRWRESFENFLADMGPRPDNLTLERIDNDGNYEPSNCRWATYAEQNRNKRNIRKLTFNGITKPLFQWADDLGIKRCTLWHRIVRAGWSTEKALTYGQ